MGGVGLGGSKKKFFWGGGFRGGVGFGESGWIRRDVPVGVPLDLSTPTGMSCIGTYGENCKSDNVSKYRVLLVALQLLWHEN